MSEFHRQFTEDPGSSDLYEWKTDAPVLRESRMRYQLDPWGCGVDDDDEGDDADDDEGERDRLSVEAYCENDNGFGSYHEKAWKFITSNPTQIERELRRKLWPSCLQNYLEFVANVQPDDENWQQIKDRERWDQPSAIDSQVELTSIGLIDDGFDDIGFTLFEFEVGWDEEHGFSILMHRDRVLAASCGADFTNRGANLVPHAKYIQGYDFTDGDFRIEG